ncbi:uncharacterized protein FIESC28_04030 [Fusarium coffeatum]|uniref:Ecp2 effector protein domain-containing protein n=1 Tax=Fusarium coffeatum TaxID=231269 RepID=A0A366S3G7_9HYPO|nr:uncharacterized protein FIESC28_04030 [Fusarium coffeatum]RBR23175.1 hypothetical protein FIESC28_04030 [Fusarium coffeatum]
MLFKYFSLALLASATQAIPVADIEQSEDDFVLFKRDSVLSARDLELADIHGVNMTEMYKHSMFKRGDGDHIVIWVARSFLEHQDGTLMKRQQARPGKNGNYRDNRISDHCDRHSRQNHAGPNGPYSGGVQAMYRWADSHRGIFSVTTSWENLMIAGSNTGANAVYKAKTKDGRGGTNIGTMDVRNDADWTQYRAIEFSGRWRASSKGEESCQGGKRISYEIVRSDYRV